MLNREQLKELCDFKMMMKHQFGILVNIEQLLQNETYQNEMLEIAETSDDEILMMLSLTIRSQYGCLRHLGADLSVTGTNTAPLLEKEVPISPRTQAVKQVPTNKQKHNYEEEAKALENTKYVFSLR